MAETVHLFLKCNGEDIKGDSTQTSQGREGSIECLYFEDSVRTAREAGSGMATGRRTFEPLVIRKRIDQSSPLLARALCNNEVCEGEFKFYRPNPDGDGTTQHYFTIRISGARIASIKRVSPDVSDPASAVMPALEMMSIVVNTISWTYEPTGAEHEDTWSDNA
ncbi:MAG: type VI secretion system tube protein TssD [Nannocystaceae bacterium]